MEPSAAPALAPALRASTQALMVQIVQDMSQKCGEYLLPPQSPPTATLIPPITSTTKIPTGIASTDPPQNRPTPWCIERSQEAISSFMTEETPGARCGHTNAKTAEQVASTISEPQAALTWQFVATPWSNHQTPASVIMNAPQDYAPGTVISTSAAPKASQERRAFQMANAEAVKSAHTTAKSSYAPPLSEAPLALVPLVLQVRETPIPSQDAMP